MIMFVAYAMYWFLFRSNSATDIAKYVESTTTGNVQAMPVGRKFTRQNTRELTELMTQEVTSNGTGSVKNDPVKAAKAQESRQHDAQRDIKKQEERKMIFKKQGSLRSFTSNSGIYD